MADVKATLLDRLNEDTEESVDTGDASQEGEVTMPTPVDLLEPKKGEVLFEPIAEGVLVRTVDANAKELVFPLVTGDKELIKYCKDFAEHCGLLTVTEG